MPALPLLSPQSLEFPTIPTPVLTQGLPVGFIQGLRPVDNSQGRVLNPAADIGSFLVSSSGSLTMGVADNLSQIVGATGAVGVLDSVGAQLSALGVIGGHIAGIIPVRAVVDLKLNDVSVTVGVNESVRPNVAVKVDARLTESNTIDLDVRIGQEGSAGIPLQGNEIINFGGANVALDIGANPGSSRPRSRRNGDADLGGEIGTNRGSGVKALDVGANVGSDHNGGLGLSLSGSEASIATLSQGTATTPDTPIPFGVDNGPESVVVHAPTGSDAAAETIPESSQLVAFLPWQANSGTAVLYAVAGGAEVVKPDKRDAPPAALQATVTSGTSELDEDSPIPPPRSKGLPAELLPLNLAALEGDIQTFLEQVEQLGAELSSLLGRMNLSPLLMAAAIAALAGELARRRMQRPRARPLLAACEDATGAWFPGLAGPWSLENP